LASIRHKTHWVPTQNTSHWDCFFSLNQTIIPVDFVFFQNKTAFNLICRCLFQNFFCLLNNWYIKYKLILIISDSRQRGNNVLKRKGNALIYLECFNTNAYYVHLLILLFSGLIQKLLSQSFVSCSVHYQNLIMQKKKIIEASHAPCDCVHYSIPYYFNWGAYCSTSSSVSK